MKQATKCIYLSSSKETGSFPNTKRTPRFQASRRNGFCIKTL